MANKFETESPMQWEACESALRDLGIDEAFVIEKLKEKLEAKNRRWNAKKKSSEQVDHQAVQLAAARELAKISGAHRLRKRKKDDVPPIIIGDIIPYEKPGGREGSEGDTIERRRP